MSEFDWGLYPEAGIYLRSLVDGALHRSETIQQLAREIEKRTSTDFFEWVDHLVLPEANLDRSRLLELRFHESERMASAFSKSKAPRCPHCLKEKKRRSCSGRRA